MIRMADTYYEEDNLEKAYILYFKFVTLFVEKLPKHPEYKCSEIAKEKIRVIKTLKNVMPRCETIKKSIRVQYQEQYQIFLQHVLIAKTSVFFSFVWIFSFWIGTFSF